MQYKCYKCEFFKSKTENQDPWLNISSAVKLWIVINRIQIKSCWVLCTFIMYIEIQKHARVYLKKNIFMFIY